MIFKDRVEAGKKLAAALEKYNRSPEAVILGLPRGGAVVAAEAAKLLNLPLDIIVPRKIGAEFNPEYAIGAITETGETIWNEEERQNADPEYLKRIIKEEQAEAMRRLNAYRGARLPRDIKNKIAILVDDGVATGLTMRAAIKTARAERPKKIVVAVPHGAGDSMEIIKKEANEIIVLFTPAVYGAVGQFYESFEQVEDNIVINLLKQAE
ncbi:phosphoribosyltransferase [Candidatus Uhrbacteria bacterium]|nr:phosphoribosyltransferase [Candidatus Uhrbacteria bacterium]